MTQPPLNLPEAVRLRAAAAGDAGRQWIERLPDTLASLEADWDIRVGEVLSGGSEALVEQVRRADGTTAILKVGMPEPGLASEARVLRHAGGVGYARLYAHDERRNAILIERLGKPLGNRGLPVAEQIEALCATLRAAWHPLDSADGFMTGAEKARWLKAFIVDTNRSLGEPCAPATIDRALAFADEREDAHDPSQCVLVHGDGHAMNALEVLESGAGGAPSYKFVDPDGLFAERACDLAIPMRDWNEELLAGDPVRLARERCALLAALTGVDEHAIWQWGFVERVSTGLVLLHLRMTDEGRAYVAVADRLA